MKTLQFEDDELDILIDALHAEIGELKDWIEEKKEQWGGGVSPWDKNELAEVQAVLDKIETARCAVPWVATKSSTQGDKES